MEWDTVAHFVNLGCGLFLFGSGFWMPPSVLNLQIYLRIVFE